MRGRTNVMQRTGATVNGDVMDFVVASGSLISVGDFVSYEISSEFVEMFTNKEFVDRFQVDDYKWVVTLKDYDSSSTAPTGVVLLVDVENGNFNILDSISVDYIFGVYYGKSENKLTVVLQRQGSNRVYRDTLSIYSIVSDKFNLISENLNCPAITDSNTTLALYKIVPVGENYFVVYSYWNDRVSSDVGFICRVLNSDFTSAVSFIGTWRAYSSGDDSYSASVERSSFFVHFDEDLQGIYLFHPSVYRKNSYGVFTIIENTITVKKNTDTANFTGIVYNGKKSCFMYDSVNVRYDLYSISNDTLTLVTTLSGTVPTFVNPNKVISFLFSSSGNSYSGNLQVFEYDEDTRTFVVVQNSDEDFTFVDEPIAINSGSYCYESRVGKFLYFFENGGVESVGYCVLVYDGEFLELGEPTGLVENYNGKSTLGFAKTGGGAGETIQVYVPPVVN